MRHVKCEKEEEKRERDTRDTFHVKCMMYTGRTVTQPTVTSFGKSSKRNAEDTATRRMFMLRAKARLFGGIIYTFAERKAKENENYGRL